MELEVASRPELLFSSLSHHLLLNNRTSTSPLLSEDIIPDNGTIARIGNGTNIGSGLTGSSSGGGWDDYFYDYELEESESTFFWPELITALAVYGVTMLLGLVGNSLIIFTISRNRRMKSTTNLFLASLASADLLLIIMCIPVKVAKLFSYSWTLGLFLCKWVHYMQSVSAICSVLTLTAMSLERYYAIVHPMKAKYVCTMSQARRIIAAIWVFSFLLAIPILIVQVQMSVGERHPAFWCVRDWDSPRLWRASELYLFILILLFPASVMAIAYTAICWEICRVIQRRSYMTSGKGGLVSECYPLRSSSKPMPYKSKMRLEEDSHTVRQVIKMLVAVVVIFVLCWAPILTDNLVTSWGLLPSVRTGPLKHMKTAFHLMAYFNSCVNPIVYGFMSKSFREGFSKALCCWGGSGRRLGGRSGRRGGGGGGSGGPRYPQRSLSVSQTRTSTTLVRTATLEPRLYS